MKSAELAAKDALNKMNENDLQEKSTLSEEAISLVNQLFTVLELHVKYFKLNKASNQAEYLSSKREWAKTFSANKITREEIVAGVNKIRALKSPLEDIYPVQFINICRDITNEEKCRVPEFASLPAPERTEESKKIAMEALREMKLKLGMR